MEAKQKRTKTRRDFGTQPKKKPALAGWPKRLGLVKVTPWAEFAIFSVQICSAMTAIFPCVHLS